jgi:hypothetical protein
LTESGPQGYARHMRLERALGLLLFVCLISLTPLAYSSPPDPTWIEGVYDDADGDDIVVSLCGAAWVVQPAPQTALAPLFVAVPFAPPSVSPIVSRDLRPTPPGRAPPLS